MAGATAAMAETAASGTINAVRHHPEGQQQEHHQHHHQHHHHQHHGQKCHGPAGFALLLAQLEGSLEDLRAAALAAERPPQSSPAGHSPPEHGGRSGDFWDLVGSEIRSADSHVQAALTIFNPLHGAASLRSQDDDAPPAAVGPDVVDAPAEKGRSMLARGRARRLDWFRRRLPARPNVRHGSKYRHEVRKKEQEVWSKCETTSNIDFFHDLLIARDGGFSEVDQLWYSFRWICALFIIGLMISNLSVIVYWDYKIIRSGLQSEPWVFNQPVIRGIWRFLHLPGDFPLDGSATICCIELFLLVFLFGRLFQLLFRAVVAQTECSKWRAMKTIFWQTIPELSTYSAMRLLHYTSPSVLAADFMKFVTYSQSRWKGKPCLLACKWFKFIVTRCFCLVIGMDAYFVKLTAFEGTLSYIDDKNITDKKLLRQVMFLVQILGIVQLDIFVRNRLFTFIFGGEDAVLQPHEKTLKAVWESMLARQIWKQHTCLRSLAIMLSFSDVDFQKLVLNERSHATKPDGSGVVESDEEESSDGSAAQPDEESGAAPAPAAVPAA